MAYAESTSVPVERSKAEIERMVQKHNCSHFATATDYDGGRAVVQFRAHDRVIRFVLQLPSPQKFAKRVVRSVSVVNPRQREDWEQACRSRWRALVLIIKGKLESVQNEIATFDEEFMPFIVMPDGRTVAEHIVPVIDKAYADKTVSLRLPASFVDSDVEP